MRPPLQASTLRGPGRRSGRDRKSFGTAASGSLRGPTGLPISTRPLAGAEQNGVLARLYTEGRWSLVSP